MHNYMPLQSRQRHFSDTKSYPRSAIGNGCIRHTQWVCTHLWRGTSPSISWLMWPNGKKLTSQETIKALEEDFRGRHGIPEKLVTDSGALIHKPRRISELCQTLHPRANGETEQNKNCEVTVEEKQRQKQIATRVQSHPGSRDSNITWSILDPEAFNDQ